MAGTIVREFGRDHLAKVVGHPFEYWRLYNEAAAGTEGAAHVLSPKAIAVLNRLEEKYGQRQPCPEEERADPDTSDRTGGV